MPPAMKLYTGIFILALCLPACGKKFMNPNGNSLLGSSVTASPLTIASDSLVTITGQGFSANPDQDLVFFNGVGAAVLQASTTQLIVKVPVAGSTGNITVRVSGEEADGPLFTYTLGSAFSISPSSGVDSTTITLVTAIHVGPAASTTVSFGNLTGKVLYTDSSRIIVSAPTGVQTSQLSIQTNGQQYAGPVFTRTTVLTVNPNFQGAGAGTLQITGTGFNPIAGQNVVTFTQSGTTRVAAAIVGGNVDTLTVKIPATAGTGPVAVNPNNQNVVTGPVFTVFAIASSKSIDFPYLVTSGARQLLSGKGFNPDINQNHLTVNGLSCTITYVSPTGDSIIYYLPDVINPSQIGTASGVLLLQSGNLTAASTTSYTEVTTLAGGSFGLTNGSGKSAQFETLSGICWGNPNPSISSGSSYFYVCDRQANNIRQITEDGVVTLVAGSPTGQAGYAEGIGASALFNAPSGIGIDNSGYLWVADSGNARIRLINLSTYQVTTLAGTGTPGTADGPGSSAQFLGPNGMVLSVGYQLQASATITDAGGGTGSIRTVARDNYGNVTVTTDATGLTDPHAPVGVSAGLGYLDNQAVYTYQSGSTVLAGTPGSAGLMNGPSGALFNNPAGLGYFFSGSYGIFELVSDAGNNVIRVINNQTGSSGPGPYPVYTYVGGMGGSTAGYQDGGYRTALFNQPGPMIVINQNQHYYIYVCDVGNHAIREFTY
jgi:hypothetical protein